MNENGLYFNVLTQTGFCFFSKKFNLFISKKNENEKFFQISENLI